MWSLRPSLESMQFTSAAMFPAPARILDGVVRGLGVVVEVVAVGVVVLYAGRSGASKIMVGPRNCVMCEGVCPGECRGELNLT